MKVSKIEVDQIKQGCNCEFHQGRSRKYKVSECKACVHKQGKSFIRRQKEYVLREMELALQKHKESEAFQEQLIKAFSTGVLEEEKPKETIKINWLQKIFRIKKTVS